MNIAEQLAGWMPVRVQWQQGAPLFDWCYLGERRFTESFFDQTIEAVLRRPLNLFLRPLTPVGVLEECDRIRPGLKPDGLIFHLSRCGSTLVSQMLAALEENVVISEASTLDWMIRARVRQPNISDDEQIKWIRWTASALGQKRTPQSKHFFIKLDAWHTFNFDILERAFPDVPWIFLYRNPLEVMVSHQRQRGAGTVPGMIDYNLPGLRPEDALEISPEEYIARFLAEVCQFALTRREHPNGLFVNYNELPRAFADEILPHFKVNYTTEQIERMNAAARFDAKTPRIEFASDTAAKQREATDEMRRLSDEMLLPLYEKLEEARYNRRR